MDRDEKRDSWAGRDVPSARTKAAMDTFRAEPVWTEDTCDVYGSYFGPGPHGAPMGDSQLGQERDLYSWQNPSRQESYTDVSPGRQVSTYPRNVNAADGPARRESRSHSYNYRVPMADVPVSPESAAARGHTVSPPAADHNTDVYYATYDPSNGFFRRHTAHSKTNSQDSGVESNQDEVDSPFHRRHTVPVPEGSVLPVDLNMFQDKEELERLNARLSGYIERIRVLEDRNRVLQTQLQETAVDGEISHMFDSWEEGGQKVKFGTLKRGRLMPEVRESLELTISRWEAAAQEYKTRWEEEERCRKECEAKLLEREKDLYDSRRETQEAQLKLRRLQDTVQNLDAESVKLREELQEARIVRDSQTVQNGEGNYDRFAADMADALQEIRVEYDTMAQQKIQEAEAFYKAQIDTLSSTVNVNHKKLEDATAKIRKYRAEVEALKKEKREFKTLNTKIQNQLQEAESSRHAQSEKYEGTISVLEGNLARLRDEMIEQHINSHNVNLALKRDLEANKKLVEVDPNRFYSLSAMLSPPKKQTNDVLLKDASTSHNERTLSNVIDQQKEEDFIRKEEVINDDMNGGALSSSEEDHPALEESFGRPPDIIPQLQVVIPDDTEGNTDEDETNYSLTDFWTPKTSPNHRHDEWPTGTPEDTVHVSPPTTLQPSERAPPVVMATLSDESVDTVSPPVRRKSATDWATLLSPRSRVSSRRTSAPDLHPPQPLAPKGHDHIRYLLGGYRVQQLPLEPQEEESEEEDETREQLIDRREASEDLRASNRWSEIVTSLKVEDEEDDRPPVGPSLSVPHLTGKWLEDSYFSIVCRSTGHAMDILPLGGEAWAPGGGDVSAPPSTVSRKFKHGAHVVVAERHERSDSQMWYYITGAIVNKATNYVLTVKDDAREPGTPVLVCAPSKREGQHWTVLADGHILSQLTGFCLTVEVLTSPCDLGHVMMSPHRTDRAETQVWDIMASETDI